MQEEEANLASHSEIVITQGFWRRQFAPTITKSQVHFDVLLGILLPILCFVYDPIVLRESKFTADLLLVELSPYRLMVYAFSALSILAFTLWLTLGRKLKLSGNIVAGVLFSGALGSLLIGIAILPVTIRGLMMIIGFPKDLIYGKVMVRYWPFTGKVRQIDVRRAYFTRNHS
jgi:hypothetical protein